MKTHRVLLKDRTNVKMCVIVKTRFFVVLPLIHNRNEKNSAHYHCVKSVQIRSYFWCVFSYIRTEYGDLRGVISGPYSVRIEENTDQK